MSFPMKRDERHRKVFKRDAQRPGRNERTRKDGLCPMERLAWFL